MTATSAPTEAPILLSPIEAARLLGVGRSTVYDLMAAGDLPSLKVGRSRRIRRTALLALVERLAA